MAMSRFVAGLVEVDKIYKAKLVPPGWVVTQESRDYYTFVHEDYDGPPSPLCGWGHSHDDCLKGIAEIIAELDEQPDYTPRFGA